MGGRCLDFITKDCLQVLEAGINRLGENCDCGGCGVAAPYVLLCPLAKINKFAIVR